jgi:uncharacterized membrane protein YkvA (DUF1232 family)
VLLGVLVSLLVTAAILWVLLVGLLWRLGRTRGGSTGWREALRLVPDVLVLLRRMERDQTVSRSVRWRIRALLAYLLSPVDIVPDFIPVVGYADDAIIAVLTIRSVARRAGTAALERNWPGTEDGLAALKSLAGLPPGDGS